ncbi:MAG: type II secretion system F family protein [Propionibacteriaceae bacterium]|nr:type II secretion system F family protein [Propionibacteriaceae bacterium]
MTGAALVAALAAALLIGPRAGLRRLEPPRPARQWKVSPWAVLAITAAVGVGGAFGARAVGWLAVASIALGTAGWLVVAAGKRRAQARRAAECAVAARVLSSLLRSGQIPTAALAEAALDAPVLAPAAAAARLGADVGAELIRAADAPGQAGLLSIAAAWSVSERSGAPVAAVLTEVAENLRRQRQLQAVVESELAAARTSGHIMAGLPFLAVGLGFMAGADPLAFLFGGVVGQVLVLAAVTLTAAGVLWIDRLARVKQVVR